MLIMIETKNGVTTNINTFSDINDTKRYIDYCRRFNDAECVYSHKNLKVYTLKDGTNVIRIDSDTVSLTSAVPDGSLITTINTDPNFPGLGVEYSPENAQAYPEETIFPRLLIEKSSKTNKLAAMLWEKSDSEDYTYKCVFE